MDSQSDEMIDESALSKGLVTNPVMPQLTINELKHPDMFKLSNPEVMDTPKDHKRDSKNYSTKIKQQLSGRSKRGEWLDAKKRQVQGNEEAAHVKETKRRHFYDTDWDELWYFPGN